MSTISSPNEREYGHQAGDQALRRVAQVVQGFARRPLDIAARYGGEEFVLALFDLSAENVREMADQLRKSIHALNIMHEDSATALFVTASIGVAIVGRESAAVPMGLSKWRTKLSTAQNDLVETALASSIATRQRFRQARSDVGRNRQSHAFRPRALEEILHLIAIGARQLQFVPALQR